jgi:hypothetical protein
VPPSVDGSTKNKLRASSISANYALPKSDHVSYHIIPK